MSRCPPACRLVGLSVTDGRCQFGDLLAWLAAGIGGYTELNVSRKDLECGIESGEMTNYLHSKLLATWQLTERKKELNGLQLGQCSAKFLPKFLSF